MSDAVALSEDQIAYVSAVTAKCTAYLTALTPAERAVVTDVWTLLARTAAPVVVRARYANAQVGQSALTKLMSHGLLWFDSDLRAVLQCPPFSALTTTHRVKAFGWNAAFVCSFVDIPLALLLYGPNTWLSAYSACPHSGEQLAFRMLMTDQLTLRLDAPVSASRWRVWLPLLPDSLVVGSSGGRSRVNAFFTDADLDTYLYYHPTECGYRFTLEQALYLGQALLRVYHAALSRSR